MARTKIASGSIEAWLRSQPGPMSSEVSPQRVLRDAHDLYVQTCPEPVELGEFIDHLWGRGLTVEAVGNRYWLKLPGVTKEFAMRRDTPTRIDG